MNDRFVARMENNAQISKRFLHLHGHAMEFYYSGIHFQVAWCAICMGQLNAVHSFESIVVDAACTKDPEASARDELSAFRSLSGQRHWVGRRCRTGWQVYRC